MFGIFGNICPTVDTLFQNAEVEQSLTTVVVCKSVRHRYQIIRTSRVEDLRSATYAQSAVSFAENDVNDNHSLLVEVHSHRKVVKHTVSEWCCEQHLPIVDVAEELKSVRVRSGLAENRASLQDDLVGAEVTVEKGLVSVF